MEPTNHLAKVSRSQRRNLNQRHNQLNETYELAGLSLAILLMALEEKVNKC
ncbi:TPA: hypothetical protein MOX26_000721 [Salmonella enterica subsp. enterica serovar Ball]|uniref:Uncharacterized protein n=3 Tax=Salmonella enterica TaxID=28901 RepID=A0A764KXW1_SALER|nr:hypothetical protein [Salmonella enterica subsp. houtenae]EDQ2089544.1 hypothetical protein [Salmonella enterica]EDQ2248413.1 hypothetical protein [Salmonella enterica subsp. enterica serovar Napoli]EDQ2743282.1 hypothetical protein [Salmonella enterica subsp. enterica serovar Zaiman]EDR3241154.1 hypothetical protein [Salmonella enterica subsp. enterica]EDT3961170.1 hypothetical protein [Salmonella enterica subsp. enterica serovar Richmond]EDW0319062.1 hypothetical protein [Salmonella ente